MKTVHQFRKSIKYRMSHDLKTLHNFEPLFYEHTPKDENLLAHLMHFTLNQKKEEQIEKRNNIKGVSLNTKGVKSGMEYLALRAVLG